MARKTPVSILPSSRVYEVAAANHDFFLLTFGETSGSTLSDKSRAVVGQSLIGTQTVWGNPTLGITPAADTAFQINASRSSAAASAKAGRIYRVDDSRISRVAADGALLSTGGAMIYIMFRLSIAAAPASDISNYLLSMGRQGAGGSPDPYGQASIRISAVRVPQLELRRRGQTGALLTPGSGVALIAGGAARSYLLLMSEATPSDLQIDWFVDASPTVSVSSTFTGALDECPLEQSGSGICLLGRGGTTSPFAPASFIGSGSVAPVVQWIGVGRCAASAANRAALLESWQAMHALGEMPAAFGRIAR